MTVLPSETQPVVAGGRRRPGLALVVALLCWVPYVVGLVLPYYANGVHQRPAGETIFAHDLGTMWPYDTPLGGAVLFVTVVGVPTVPFVSAGVAMWSAFDLWAWRRTLTRGQVALYAVAAGVAGASVAWLATPLATELLLWFWD